MDFSSLTEAQRQQLQQLQQQFQEHQAQQQQKQQEEAEAAAAAAAAAQQAQQHQYQPAYDPSQVQSYDQSYYAYYQYQQDPQQLQQSQQQPQQSQHSQQEDQQQQQYAGYYQTHYANAYQPQQSQPPQQYSQPESAAFHPPAIPVSREAPPHKEAVGSTSEGLGQGQIQVQHQQNAYYPNQVGPGGDHPNHGYPAQPGLNAAAAAAVAALSQLTQFAGTMDAAERAMAGLHDRQWYGKGRGYGPMMGHGPGAYMEPMHFAQGPMRPPIGQSPYRSSGRRGGGPFRGSRRGNFGNRPPSTGGSGPPSRGRGRGRGRGRRHPLHGASSSSQPEPSAADETEPTEEVAEEPSVDNHNEESQDNIPNQQQPIRIAWCELCRVDCTSLEILEQHKNGKRHKKNLQRLEEIKNASEPVAEIPNDGELVTDSNAEMPENVHKGEDDKPENNPTAVGTDVNNAETEENNDQERKPWKHGIKRNWRGGGRGGKRTKTFGGPARRATGPPKPKVVIPLICDLCNVKCDTQEVFDRHVAGKKHIAKLKRFEGHQAMYGPMGLQALYPPNPIAQTLYRPQGPQQAFYGQQGSYPPPSGVYIPPQAQHPNPQLSDAPLEFGSQNAVPEAQQQPQLNLSAKLQL